MSIRFLFLALTAGLVSCGGGKTELFNGRDLTGWVCVADDGNAAAESTFSVCDGNIRIAGTPFGYMRTARQYGDYRLHAEWRWVGEATNSGIFQRVQEGDGLWPDAIECQLQAGNAGDLLGLGGAAIAEVPDPEGIPIKKRSSAAGCEKPAGEWNVAEIVCKGDCITVYINGELQNACSGAKRRGHIALQSEGGPVEFRNVYLTDVE